MTTTTTPELKRWRAFFVGFNIEVDAVDETAARRLAWDLADWRTHGRGNRVLLLHVEEVRSVGAGRPDIV